MKILKLRYNREGRGDDVMLNHNITESNFGKYLKMRISRDGYEVKIIKSDPINEENPAYIELHSPRGKKNTPSSRGFRTYYRIVCISSEELEKAKYQLTAPPKS